MRKRVIALLAGALAIALIVAGCGGGNDNSTSTAALTKAEFLKQGNAICAKGNKEIEAEFEQFAKEENLSQNKPPTQAQLKKASETILIPTVTKQVEELDELGIPAGDEAQVKAVIEAAEDGIEKSEEDPTSIAVEHGGPFAKANKLAREYGLTTCGEEK